MSLIEGFWEGNGGVREPYRKIQKNYLRSGRIKNVSLYGLNRILGNQ